MKDYIEDADPLVNRYISVPSDYGHFNCAAFIAGIIHGALDAAGFSAEVTTRALAKNGDAEPRSDQVAVYYIKFDASVVERERRLGG